MFDSVPDACSVPGMQGTQHVMLGRDSLENQINEQEKQLP